MAAGAAMRSARLLNPWAGHGYYSLDISLLLLHLLFDEIFVSISHNCAFAQFRLSELLLLFYTRDCVSGHAFQAMEINGYQACLLDEISVGEHLAWLWKSP